MKISLAYTSRRAQYISKVINLWLDSAADRSRVEVVVSVDTDYAEGVTEAMKLAADPGGQITLAVNVGAANCVSGWNTAAAATTGDIIIAVADDFLPPVRWDEALEQAGPAGWWFGERVVWVSDGYNGDIFTLGIVTRRRYNRFGYLFYPGYESLFSDTELTATAHVDGVVLDARHLLFEHLHPDCNKRPRDAIDTSHASAARWKRGEMLFKLRSDTGFPLDAGPRSDALEQAYTDPKYALYIQAIRDDFCLADVVRRIVDSGQGKVKEVFIFSPDQYWDGKAQGSGEYDELLAAAKTLTDLGVPISLVRQPVAPYRLPKLSRIQVETLVRNAALDMMRQRGYMHILIADGDELWSRGLLTELTQFVQERRPASVFTGMVPVIGLPGYPVEGALDKAAIYVGPDAVFTDCRATNGARQELEGHGIIHFTATRRTKQEIIDKMRGSGHADDPNYAFEEWIAQVLPNIRPGFSHRFSPTSEGLHMYRPYQVWKSCRHWTCEEWNDLPESVKPYMSKPS